MADEGPVIDNPRERMIERPGGTDSPHYHPLPQPPTGETYHNRDRQAEQERISRDEGRHRFGFPVGGHDERDEGRGRSR